MNYKKIITLISVLMVITTSTGCEWGSSKVQDVKGSIEGITYTIDTFDNYGEQTLKTSGSKISVAPNIINERVYTNEGWGWTQTVSSVITITIDGHEMESCGDTCIFYENGLEPDYDFRLDNIDSSTDGSITDNAIIAKTVNKVKNRFGKNRVIVIKSQMGTPIYAFSGDKIYWEVAERLPKFTKISIDGKAMYIHRANFQIIDTELIQ